MKRQGIASGVIALMAVIALGAYARASTTVQVGPSGKTYASTAISCSGNPMTGQYSPVVEAGLFNPKKNMSAEIALNGVTVATVSTDLPAADVWLADGNNTVVVALSKRTGDSYTFVVQAGLCALPDTSGNTFSPDGSLEYAASGKSYATVVPGCALNPATGTAQPYVNLIDNGTYLLNVSVNGQPLTQLGATRPHVPVFLGAGRNVISAANGYLSVDYYVRDGGTGSCVLP
jgi:hypothetical protein